jgi:hypothetical protein
MDKIANILGSIVVVAGITTVVAHPQSAQVFRAIGDSFSSMIRSAIGN